MDSRGNAWWPCRNHHDFFIKLFLQTPSLSTNVQHIVGFVQNIPSVATGCEMLGFLASYRLLSWFNWPSFGSSSSTTATSEEEAKLARKFDDQPSRAFEWKKKHLVLGDDEDDEGHVIVHSHKEQLRSSELPIDLTLSLFRQSIYPVAYGWQSDIWKCAVKQDAQSSEVAVKSIRSHDLGAEDIYNKNEQLRPALKLRARLKHENILPLLGVATGFGRFTSLVYPWMENGTLASYLQRNGEQLSFHDRLELLRDAAAGLCYLHSCSIIHGQLTGSNIFVSADGRAQLSGFGFSDIVLEFLGTSYSSSSMNGIVRWAAPEILTTHDDESFPWVPTEQSDIYSLGSVMLQVCSGEVPYANLRSDAQVLLALADGVTPSRPATPWMNDRVWDFIQRLELLRDAAAGLCYLHSCSIIHGQLTGSNIFVSADGRAQLSGFGFSDIVLEFLGTSYSSSSMNGIVRWAAPEILTTHDDESFPWVPTEQSDIYSLGSVMLQVCSGEVPYANLRSDAQVLLALADGVTPSRPATPWMNDRVWDFIQRCWLAEERGAERPSAEEALNFIQEEISLLCPTF
ncbi:hypothetical protein PAXINDRAFT_102482 [Paxillus involutus ATCC 200175]|uniref:Protein kinase domain-containing protein n=1 Tax=Paxillus involutus ATCC 200175 TaxID=664439 RepID=A0A0C9TLT5_PAXIN|nr:hypothetical protein PAXINDRAFT_102482 [Paxillus involutus ATCC 200175]